VVTRPTVECQIMLITQNPSDLDETSHKHQAVQQLSCSIKITDFLNSRWLPQINYLSDVVLSWEPLNSVHLILVALDKGILVYISAFYHLL